MTDEEWPLVAPYPALCREDAAQRDYPLREVLNALRYVVRTGCQWRYLTNDLPPWSGLVVGTNPSAERAGLISVAPPARGSQFVFGSTIGRLGCDL